MPRILTFILLLFIASNLQAQSWEVGGFAGGAGYMGDLNPNNPLKVSGMAGGGFVKRNFDRYWSAKLNYVYGNISAADSTSSKQQFRDRNLSFSTKLSEVSLIGEFNFFEYMPSVTSNVYTPFIYVGIGLVNYSPQATYNGQTYDLRPLQTEGQATPYSSLALSIPYGIGIKYNFTGKWNLIADIGYRQARTDYLDDVGSNYPNKSTLSNSLSVALSDRSGEKTGVYTGAAGTQRGDQRGYDTYLFVGLSISFTFITPKCYY